MRNFFLLIKQWIHARIHGFLLKSIDISESNEVVRIITRNIGLTWVEMENHVRIRNKFIIPYQILEVKLTYYNDARQNIGYLHFKGPVRIGGFSQQTVKMPAKMSNITALFNVARLLIIDHIKTRTVGTTTIRLLGMTFELPVDDIMIVDKDKIVTEEMDAAEKERRELERKERAAHRELKRAERKARQAARTEAMARKRAERREKMAARRHKARDQHVTDTETPANKKEPPAAPSTPSGKSSEKEVNPRAAGSSGPDRDKSYPDPSA